MAPYLVSVQAGYSKGKGMAQVLTESEIRRFEEDGFLFPFEVYAPEEAGVLATKFAAIEDKLGYEPQKKFRIKAQLPFPWLCDVVRHPRLLDAVEDLIGPNILCWGASFFTKQANDVRYVSWHTDSYVYGFEPAETLTAWLAFNDATVESGCVRYVPGSHRADVSHEIRPDADNLVTLGQHAVGVAEDKAVYAELRAGQVVFHHEKVVHGSGPNRAGHPRVGFSIHYVAPHVRETRFEGSTAMLLRGRDDYGHWGADPEPTMDFDPVCVEAMEATRAKYMQATERRIASGEKF